MNPSRILYDCCGARFSIRGTRAGARAAVFALRLLRSRRAALLGERLSVVWLALDPHA